jgi:DNA-binding NarL/FixJ family response regulator
MSSDVFLTVPQLLARHCREVILLVIGDLVLPHDEDDLQPFRGQRPERLAMSVSPRPLLVVVGAGPDTRVQREERHVVDHVAQRLVMPGMGGSELAERLAATNPKLRVLRMSGYADEMVAAASSEPGRLFLPKPFTPHDLAKTVRQALAGR